MSPTEGEVDIIAFGVDSVVAVSHDVRSFIISLKLVPPMTTYLSMYLL